jgi:hypothetical protein
MDTGAIISMVIMWLVFIVGLVFCFLQIGKGGEWED